MRESDTRMSNGPTPPSSPSDAHLLARCRLLRSGHSVLRGVHCESDGSTLRLSGLLPSHRLKQIAQAVVAEVEGVRVVVNEIEVVRPSEPSEAAERFREV